MHAPTSSQIKIWGQADIVSENETIAATAVVEALP